MAEVLRLEHVCCRFGGVQALDDVSLQIHQGEIIGLIGPNGAGKTTLVNMITGAQRPSTGRLWLGGVETTGWQAHRTARQGVARTFQIVQPFLNLSVHDNVAAAILFSQPGTTMAQARADALYHLEFVGLQDQARQSTDTLPLAMRKRLELAKALAMQPKLLLLDEVQAGLNTAEMQRAMDLIRAVSARGVTIVLIEHLMRVVLDLSTRLLVLHEGRLIADGDPASVVRDKRVIQAYLGRGFAQEVPT